MLYPLIHRNADDFFIDGSKTLPEKKKNNIEITKATRVSEILETYGDIAEVMELFGVKSVAPYSLRSLIAKAITVEWAARIHGVSLDKFIEILRQATKPDGVQSRKKKRLPAGAKMSDNTSQHSFWRLSVVGLSLLLIFFTIPHTLEDFSLSEPAKNGVPAPVLAYVVAGLFVLQGLALYWAGQKDRRGYFIHIGLGVFWPLAAGIAQLPTILTSNHFRSGLISVIYVVGMIVVSILLFLASIRALRVHGSQTLERK